MKLVVARRLAIVGTALFGAVLLAGCAAENHAGVDHDSGSPVVDASPSGAAFNDADVRFATDMIIHHRQAIAMAQAASTRAGDSEVKDLASRVKAAQDPEIATMSGWLTQWNQPVPPAGDDTNGMDHGGHMPAMMTNQEMGELMAAKGGSFDKPFLRLMIRHHQGAIEMATTARAQGHHAGTKQLAATIVADQRAEITQMRAILDQMS